MSKVTFDGNIKLIIIDEGITTISVQSDIFSAWKEWLLLDDNAKYLPAFRNIGGDSLYGNVSVAGTYFLINDWRIRPSESDQELTVIGNLYVDGGGNPFISTVGSYNVLINLVTSSIVTTVYVDSGSSGQSGSTSITAQDKTDIANAVGTKVTAAKNEILSSVLPNFTLTENNIVDQIFDSSQTVSTNITTAQNNVKDQVSLSAASVVMELTPKLDRILGLVQSNFKFTNQKYNTKGNLTTGTMKIYSNSSDCDRDRNAIGEYAVTAEYDSKDLLIDYKVLQIS